jgi:arylsulfatase A-like enzyme
MTAMKFPAFLIAALLPAACLAAAGAAAKPNVILIYSDDHGFADLGAQGVDRDIRTPHLDALARDGVRFARGYVTAPQCVPSRAGVITGRYQQRFGVDDNLKGPLPLAELTIAERLKAAGYVSAQVGKWHLEPTPRAGAGAKKTEENPHGFLPGAQGFDEYFCGPMNNFVASHDLKGNKLPNAPATLTDKRFRCVWQADAAVSFIERHRRDPFFLYLAFFTPHVPLESPEPWFSQTSAHLPKERRQALAMIAAMDEGIGRIRAALQTQGLDQNTLIFFIGDNGAPLKPGAWNGSLNLPLTGEKGMLTDGGVRTPFVAAWPGTLPAGKVYEPAVSALDVAATAVALAGLPHDPALDGVNLVPFLTGRASGDPHAALFWRWRTQAAVLEGRWKLVLLGPQQRYLFDTTTPEGETRNLLAEHPAIADRLLARLKAWDATLQTPGLPTDTHAQDQHFFSTYVDQKPSAAATEPATPKAKKKRRSP